MKKHLYFEDESNFQPQETPRIEPYEHLTEIGDSRYKMKMRSTGALIFTVVLSGLMAAIGITLVVLYIIQLNKSLAENSVVVITDVAGIAGFFFLIAALPFFLRKKTVFDTASSMIIVGKKAYPFDGFVKFEVSNLYCFIKVSTILWIKIRMHNGSKPKSLRIKILGPLARTKTTEKYFKEIACVMRLQPDSL